MTVPIGRPFIFLLGWEEGVCRVRCPPVQPIDEEQALHQIPPWKKRKTFLWETFLIS